MGEIRTEHELGRDTGELIPKPLKDDLTNADGVGLRVSGGGSTALVRAVWRHGRLSIDTSGAVVRYLRL